MAQADYPYRNDRTAPKRENTVARSGWMREWWFRMLVVLFFAELIVPFLLWRAGLPRSMDFFKEIVAGVIVLLTFSFILLRDRIPLALLFILGVSLIWSLVPVSYTHLEQHENDEKAHKPARKVFRPARDEIGKDEQQWVLEEPPPAPERRTGGLAVEDRHKTPDE